MPLPLTLQAHAAVVTQRVTCPAGREGLHQRWAHIFLRTLKGGGHRGTGGQEGLERHHAVLFALMTKARMLVPQGRQVSPECPVQAPQGGLGCGLLSPHLGGWAQSHPRAQPPSGWPVPTNREAVCPTHRGPGVPASPSCPQRALSSGAWLTHDALGGHRGQLLFPPGVPTPPPATHTPPGAGEISWGSLPRSISKLASSESSLIPPVTGRRS